MVKTIKYLNGINGSSPYRRFMLKQLNVTTGQPFYIAMIVFRHCTENFNKNRCQGCKADKLCSYTLFNSLGTVEDNF